MDVDLSSAGGPRLAPTEAVSSVLELAVLGASAQRAAVVLVGGGVPPSCPVRCEVGPEGLRVVTAATELPGSIPHSIASVLDQREARRLPATSLPDPWSALLGEDTLVMAPVYGSEGPLALVVLGWDSLAPDERAEAAARLAGRLLGEILETAIAGQTERTWRIMYEQATERAHDSAAAALTAVAIRAGLLRLVAEPSLDTDLERIETMARDGLDALRRSERLVGGGERRSDSLFHSLVDLTATDERLTTDER